MVKTFQQLINESLVRDEHEGSGKYVPSSFGRCYRAQYWRRKKEPKSNPPDERTLRVFKAGQLFEDFVVGLLPEKGYKLQVEVETPDVLGYADIVSENEVCDVKSVHSKSFWWMTKSKDIKKDKYHNWLQVMFYVWQLDKKFGRLCFISKDDLCIQEYVEPFEGYWAEQLDEELSSLRIIWASQKLPPACPRCEPNKKGEYWDCAYCDYLDKCIETEIKAGRNHPMSTGE